MIQMQEVYILPLKKPGLRHLSRLSKIRTYALRGDNSEWSQEARQLKVPYFLVHLSSSEVVLVFLESECTLWSVVEQNVLDGWNEWAIIV